MAGHAVGAVAFVIKAGNQYPSSGTTNITTSCDGILALRQVGKLLDHIRCSTQRVDLVSSTLADFWNILKFNPTTTEHVYGHHRDKSNDDLTVLERLNCRMDSLAKSITLQYI